MDDLAGAIGGCLWRNGENLKETITNYNKAREQIMDEIKKIIESGKLFYVYPHPSDDYESIIRALDFTLEHLNKLDPILTTDRKTDLMISLEKFKACIENGKIKIIFSYENK